MAYKLKTSAGSSFDSVAKEAKAKTYLYELVQFVFNEVECLVNKDTNLEWLYRDYSNSWLMEWKTVGPDCMKEYEPEIAAEFKKRVIIAEEKAEKRREEYQIKENKERAVFNENILGVDFEVIPGKEKEYAKYAANNSKDGYGRAVIDYSEGWAKIMQIEIAKGNTVKEIAEASQKGLGFLGITGFQYGCAVQGLANFWKHGEELRKWHNKEYGHEGDGVVNPAILTIKS